MQSMDIPRLETWRDAPFYRFLFENLPAYRSKRGLLDVPRLAKDVGLTPEGIYKWLRKSQITIQNARTLFRLCNAHDNVAALSAAEREPPVIERFYEFCE